VLIAVVNLLIACQCILTHTVKFRDSAISCAKMAEPIEMQFRMLSRVGPGNVYYMEM